MAIDLEQLQVTLSAKIGEFQSSMRQAGQSFDIEASRIESRNQELTTALSTQMQGVGSGISFITNAFKGLVIGAAIGTLIEAFDKAQQSLASLSKQADETRLSVQDLLSLRVAGAGAGVGIDEMNKALAFFSEQSKKTQEDARGLYKALDQVGPGFRKAFADASSQPERVELISRAMASLTDQVKRDQLEMGAFGTTSDRLKAVLDTMAGSFDTLRIRAESLGISIDSGLAERADDAQKKLGLLHEIIADKLAIALVNFAETIRSAVIPAFLQLSPILTETVNQMAKDGETAVRAFNMISTAIKLGRETGHIPSPTVTRAIVEADEMGVEPGTPEASAPGLFAPALTIRKGAYKPTEDLSKKPASGSDDEYDREEKRINKQIITLKGQEAAIGKVGEAAAKAEASTRLWAAADEAKLAHTDALRDKINALADTYAKVKVRLDEVRVATDLVFEREQLGRGQDEQAVFSRLRGSNLGADAIDPKTGEKLIDQMRTIQNLTQGKEMAGSFVKGLISDLENGVKAGQALENQLKRIADKLADKAIDNLISGIFGKVGGLFGGGGMSLAAGELGQPGPGFAAYEASLHAQGGWAGKGPLVNVPASAFIGAKHFAAGGGIPAILHAGEIVLTQAQQKNVAQGLGPSKPISITHAPTINGAGMTPEQVFGLVTRSQKEFARNILPIFNNAQRRFG